MISEEHWENDEISFKNVNGHNEPVKLRILGGMLITYYVCDFFVLWVSLHEERKRDVIVPEKLWNST